MVPLCSEEPQSTEHSARQRRRKLSLAAAPPTRQTFLLIDTSEWLITLLTPTHRGVAVLLHRRNMQIRPPPTPLMSHSDVTLVRLFVFMSFFFEGETQQLHIAAPCRCEVTGGKLSVAEKEEKVQMCLVFVFDILFLFYATCGAERKKKPQVEPVPLFTHE